MTILRALRPCTLLFLLTAGCEKCATGRVADGVARLTIRNVGAIADRLEKDTGCGFESAMVKSHFVASGAPGEMGSVSWSVTDCQLDPASVSAARTDCKGVVEKASGTARVSAKRTIRGKLTGDPERPVIPVSPDAVTLELEDVRLENFAVSTSNSDARLTQLSGTLSAKLEPRLAGSLTDGVCSIVTPNVRFSGVAYRSATVHVTTSDHDFDVDVGASLIDATSGRAGSEENSIHGSIDVWGQTEEVPGDGGGLDPSYHRNAFDASWMCGDIDTKAPFDCSLDKPLAQGAAQLSIEALGTLAELVEKDASCGFSSAQVIAGARTSGTLGDPGGSATFTIASPCKISFLARTAAKSDCNMKTTWVEGTALVTGTKTLRGYATGDPKEPIVPDSRDPAVLEISASLSNFKVSTSADDNAITFKSGTLSGSIEPRTAIDTTTGACSIATPVARFTGVRYQDAVVELAGMGMTFEVNVSASNLEATSGARDGITNSLHGTIVVDGMSYDVPVSGQGQLDPAYDAAAFDKSYACTANMRIPTSDADCKLEKELAGGAARLIIQALGDITQNANDDLRCGFSSPLVLPLPSSVTGSDGQMGSIEWTIHGCDLPRPRGPLENAARGPFLLHTDCLQRASYLNGHAAVSGIRHVDGLRQDIHVVLATVASIAPNTPESVHVHMDSVVFDEFQSYALDPGQNVPSLGVTIHRGTVSALVEPITGEEANTPGKFDIATPVARFSQVSVSDALVTLVLEGKTFNVHLDSATLSAFNGSFSTTGEKNAIRGTVSAFGRSFALDGAALDPSYDQADFDRRYACTANLRAPVPPAR